VDIDQGLQEESAKLCEYINWVILNKIKSPINIDPVAVWKEDKDALEIWIFHGSIHNNFNEETKINVTNAVQNVSCNLKAQLSKTYYWSGWQPYAQMCILNYI
jgi:hypothetical protein